MKNIKSTLLLLSSLLSVYSFASEVGGTISRTPDEKHIVITPLPPRPDGVPSFDIDTLPSEQISPPAIEQHPMPSPVLPSLEQAKEALQRAKSTFIAQLQKQTLSALKRANLDDSQGLGVAKALNDILNPNLLISLSGIQDPRQLQAFAQSSEAKLRALIPLIKSVDNTINTVAKGLGNVNGFSKPSYFSELTTTARLAKLSNPYNADLATTYALNKISKDKFASADDISLSSTVKSYTNRFKYDSNAWVNALAGAGHIKNFANPKVYGIIAGYDRVADNAIIGLSTSYSVGKTSNTTMTQKTNNYEVSLYSRFFLLNNYELDLRANVGRTNGKLSTTDSAGAQNAILERHSKYRTVFVSFNADYGYIFELSDATFIKPFVGFNYTYAKMSGLNLVNPTNPILNIDFDNTDSKVLTLRGGLDFRKYISNGNYFYITPAIETEAIKNIATNIIRIGNSDTIIVVPNSENKKTYFMLSSGAQIYFTDYLSGNFGLGIKTNAKDQYYNGSLGLRFRF